MRVNNKLLPNRTTFLELLQYYEFGMDAFRHNHAAFGLKFQRLVNMIYIDAHDFIRTEQYDLISRLAVIRNPNLEWIVLDLRTNFGGYLDVLHAILYYLYPKEVVKYVMQSE